jgi:hypothetical protein
MNVTDVPSGCGEGTFGVTLVNRKGVGGDTAKSAAAVRSPVPLVFPALRTQTATTYWSLAVTGVHVHVACDAQSRTTVQLVPASAESRH